MTINKIDIDGPIQNLFCPVCCNGIRFDSDYALRVHLDNNHVKDMDKEEWSVTKDYINGRSGTKRFYSDVDDTCDIICDMDQ